MGEATTVMSLGGDYDATRAVTLRARIARIAGVNHVEFNYTNNRVTVQFDPDLMGPEELEGLVMREKKHHFRSVTKLTSSNEVG